MFWMSRAAIVTIRPYHALAIVIDNRECATKGNAYVNASEKQEAREGHVSDIYKDWRILERLVSLALSYYEK